MNNSNLNIFINKCSSILNVANELLPIVKDTKPMISKVFNLTKGTNISKINKEKNNINEEKKNFNNPKFFI